MCGSKSKNEQQYLTLYVSGEDGLGVMQAGDRVGVVRNDDGSLHFFVNGVDQGLATSDVPPVVYGVIDLYGQAAQATIIDSSGNVCICVSPAMPL